MGFNTTVLFLNDAVHLLTEDKKFPEKLLQAIRMAGSCNPDRAIDVSLSCHVNAVRVLGVSHADNLQIFGIGGNTGQLLGLASCYNSEHTVLRRLAAQHGYRLVKDDELRYSGRSLECDDCRVGADHGSCYDCKSKLDASGVCVKKCGGRR
jgi:hypothetical protein